MNVFTELTTTISRRERGVALGTFDGVHLGHQELLRRLVVLCRREGLVPTVFTFSDHPEMVFGQPGSFPGFLMDQQHRLDAFRELGIEDVFVFPLVPEIYELSAEHFLNRWFAGRLNAKLIAVGRDANFGAGKTGGTAFLQDWCLRNGVQSLIVGDVYLDGQKVSSTRIRNAFIDKDIELANRMLAHPYRLSGHVTKGRNLGSKHGIPTANFRQPASRLALPFGVYASRVEVDGRWYDAISNIGVSPTVDPASTDVRVESFLYEYSADMYEKPIQVEILKYIRSEIAYGSFEEMMPQIEIDKEKVRQFHETAELPVIRFQTHGIPVVSLTTSRFHFGHACLLFRLRAVKKRMTALAILLNMMTRRTAKYCTPAELEQRLAALGDAGLSAVFMQEGDVQLFGLRISAPESEAGGRHLSEAVSLMIEAYAGVFFDYDEAAFDTWFEHEKSQLIAQRLAEDEDKIERAVRFTIETLLDGQPHAYHFPGDADEIRAVTKTDLLDAFEYLQNDAFAALYVSGRISGDLLDRIGSELTRFPKASRPGPADTWPLEPVLTPHPDRKVQTDTTQHIVVMAVQNGAAWYEADRWADYVYAELLGGGQNSLLFTKLRDEEALGYQIFMIPFNVIGISLLVAATTPDKADAVRAGFLREIERIARDAVPDDRLEEARLSLLRDLTEIWDHSGARLMSLINWHIYGYSGHIDDKKSFLHDVEHDDVIRVANQVKPLLVLEMTGDQDE
ncbi:MAG TPA: riboflavin biosynthesis protein RibF [Clostridiaceae bacterium]|nr:riboflavin biosynthesis protein RibF [Clostridiaceae bacterium]